MIDTVIEDLHRGLDQLIDQICRLDWRTAEPAPGTAPREEHPNLLVLLAKPAVLVTPREGLIVPLYSSRQLAEKSELRDRTEVELIEVRTSTLVIGQPAITITLAGLQQSDFPAETIHVLLDPVPTEPEWSNVECVARTDINIAELVKASTHMPISLGARKLESVYLWAVPTVHDWLGPTLPRPLDGA
jgi:hypothetical protein